MLGTVSTVGSTVFTALLVTVVRLEEQKTDLILTVNVPFTNVGLARAEGSVGVSGGTRGDLVGGELLEVAVRIRDGVLGSVRVLDWSLFVDEGET